MEWSAGPRKMNLCNRTKSGMEGKVWEPWEGSRGKRGEEDTQVGGRAKLETHPRQSLTGRNAMRKVKKCSVYAGVW